jgi:cell fate (sporulation/competence/biofilm development) regulator YlbF (YheA/YmcA/DUF963 family)
MHAAAVALRFEDAARYRDAQKAVAADPEASRLMQEFGRQLETLARQSGLPA